VKGTKVETDTALPSKHLRRKRLEVCDERDRILKTLGKISKKRRSLPSGLTGRQLCFLHIGKTAGTSVQEALFEALGDAAISHGPGLTGLRRQNWR
jgi:hypothetical protein